MLTSNTIDLDGLAGEPGKAAHAPRSLRSMSQGSGQVLVGAVAGGGRRPAPVPVLVTPAPILTAASIIAGRAPNPFAGADP